MNIYLKYGFKSESMQKSTKVADSWQGSKKSKSLFFSRLVDFSKYTNAMYFVFERSVRFREKRRKSFQAPQAISQAKNRVEMIMILDSRSNTIALGKKVIAKILSLTRRWSNYIIFLALHQYE